MDDHAEFASVIIRAMTALLAFELRKAAINVAQCPHITAAQALNDCAEGMEGAVPFMLAHYEAMVAAPGERRH